MTDIQTSCAYCGVGCGVSISPNASYKLGDTGVPFTLKGDTSHPANYGHLCAKGERLLDSLSQPNILRYPQLRSGKPIDWQAATNLIADQFSQTIAQYGPDSVAIYLSGQLLTEDYYVANKFAKGYLKTANVDTNSRLCMSSAVSAMQRAFGEDVVPGCYDDFEQAEVIILVGANSAWTHPVLFQRILAAKKSRNTKLVVIDPVKTATAKQADLHLAITPGADLTLFSGLLGYLVQNNYVDQQYINEHTEGFSHVVKDVQALSSDLSLLADKVGLSLDTLITFYELFTQHKKVMTASCQGVNQSVIGTDCTNAMINCHLALGQIGQAGSGFFSLTGQPNAMGGREVGGLATQLACHMGFSAPERQLLANFWQTDAVATSKGLAAVDMFDAVADGKIKAIWIMGTNPAVSLPNSGKIIKALEDCPFVVVSEIIPDSDTAKYADVLLPAQGWSEKCGTVTNSDRTLTRQRGFIKAKGQAKPDWWAVCQVANAMGFTGFDFTDNASVFKEYAQLSATVKETFSDKVLDLTGLAQLSKTDYDTLTPTQWPVASVEQIGQAATRLFSDGHFATASGKAQFIKASCPQQSDLANEITDNSILLSSGRSRDQWHTMTRTGHIAGLRASIPEPVIHLHPSQIAKFSLSDKGLVNIHSQFRSADSSPTITSARVKVDEDMPTNLAFMSMHWAEQFSLSGGVNHVINDQVDPVSQQPGFKCQPVTLSPVVPALQGLVFGEHDSTAKGLTWQVAQTLTSGICYHLAFEDQQDGFAYQASPHAIQWTLIVNKQLLHIQCHVEKGLLKALKILSSMPVDIALEPMNTYIGKALNSQLLKQLHQQIKAGNSPLLCTCTGVTEAMLDEQINHHLNQQLFKGSVASLNFEQALDNTQINLGCGRQCGSCQSEVTQCATTAWEQALDLVAIEQSTQEEVA